MTPTIRWLVDTNVVSEMMRPTPEPRVAAFLDSIAHQGIGLSCVTVWEILDGIGRLAPGKRREVLASSFLDLLNSLFEDKILDWSLADARASASIVERRRRNGEPLDDHIPDAFIAGTAVTRGLGLVTRNTGEFRNTGVESIDPWQSR